MSKRVKFSLLASLLMVSFSASAQPAQPKTIVTLKGKCQFQLVQGYFPCKQSVLYMLLSNGRSFYTFIKDDTMFTLNGGKDRQPNLNNHYLQIDTFRIMKGGTMQAEDKGMEGECHMSLSADGKKVHFVKCDVYNRAKGSMYNFKIDPVTSRTVKNF